MGVGDVSKRILLGRKLRSNQLGESLLPKRVALPVFASDALSSVAYAPDEVFIMLSLAGASAYVYSWRIALVIALVMLAVVASYRYTVRAYPSGGGDYEVATKNLGPSAGVTVASALLVDYVLTLSVSVSAASQYAGTAIPFLSGREVTVSIVLVVLLAALNLRGIRESAWTFALPTYLFMACILGMAGYGLARWALGTLPRAESAAFDIVPAEGMEGPLTTFALLFLLARAFSSGCVALTGVEAISGGVPAFKRPKGPNAAATLVILGLIAIAMMVSVIVLANQMGVRYVDPSQRHRLRLDGEPLPEDFRQDMLLAQIAGPLFDGFPPVFYLVITMTSVVLLFAANTAFNGFPVLGSVLARDGYAPKALGARGDRLAYSNGVVALALAAGLLVWAFDAEITALIQLYIVGVFVSFTLGQLGMIRHWTRELRLARTPAARRRMHRARVLHAIGLTLTAAVLVVVVVTKFLAGAWIAVLAMVVLYLLMRAIRRHYDRVSEELAAVEEDRLMPTRVHAIVLVSRLHKPTLRALAYAKATRPNVLEAVYVATSDTETGGLLEEWDDRNIDIPLKILHSPYRELVKPVVQYATEIRRANPRGVVAVYIPEYVVGRWWEQLLHNQAALRLKGRLLFTPGVMVTSVPYQLRSSAAALERAERDAQRSRPGDLRQGRVTSRQGRR